MKTPKRDTFFADAAMRRIDNEFWVAPDGRVVRLRVPEDPDWGAISSIVSLHGLLRSSSSVIVLALWRIMPASWVGSQFSLTMSTVPLIATRSLHSRR